MKKIPKIIIIIIMALIIGFVMSFLIHKGFYLKLKVARKSIAWYFYILIILFNFFLVILIHELGHLVSFVLNKIKIKALYVLVFVLVKQEKFQLKIRWKNIKMLGGLVVPDLPEIQNEEQYIKVKKGFAKALITGPLTSIGYFIVLLITFILIWFFANLPIITGYLYISVIVTLIMTILVHLTSKVHTNNMYGDYVAYKKFSEDKFSLLQIVQYTSFKTKVDKLTSLFLYNKIDEYFNKNKPSNHIFDKALVSYYLSYFLADNDYDPKNIEQIVNYYNITNLSRQEEGRELAYLIASYYYKEGNVEKSYQILKTIDNTKNKHLSNEKLMLLKHQYEHYLNIADHSEIIKNQKDNILKDMDLLAPLYNVDEYIIDLLETLELKQYVTDIMCYI